LFNLTQYYLLNWTHGPCWHCLVVSQCELTLNKRIAQCLDFRTCDWSHHNFHNNKAKQNHNEIN